MKSAPRLKENAQRVSQWVLNHLSSPQWSISHIGRTASQLFPMHQTSITGHVSVIFTSCPVSCGQETWTQRCYTAVRSSIHYSRDLPLRNTPAPQYSQLVQFLLCQITRVCPSGGSLSCNTSMHPCASGVIRWLNPFPPIMWSMNNHCPLWDSLGCWEVCLFGMQSYWIFSNSSKKM